MAIYLLFLFNIEYSFETNGIRTAAKIPAMGKRPVIIKINISRMMEPIAKESKSFCASSLLARRRK